MARFFQEGNAMPAPSQQSRGSRARRAAADDQDVAIRFKGGRSCVDGTDDSTPLVMHSCTG